MVARCDPIGVKRSPQLCRKGHDAECIGSVGASGEGEGLFLFGGCHGVFQECLPGGQPERNREQAQTITGQKDGAGAAQVATVGLDMNDEVGRLRGRRPAERACR
jgi:hypothetical protein